MFVSPLNMRTTNGSHIKDYFTPKLTFLNWFEEGQKYYFTIIIYVKSSLVLQCFIHAIYIFGKCIMNNKKKVDIVAKQMLKKSYVFG